MFTKDFPFFFVVVILDENKSLNDVIVTNINHPSLPHFTSEQKKNQHQLNFIALMTENLLMSLSIFLTLIFFSFSKWSNFLLQGIFKGCS